SSDLFKGSLVGRRAVLEHRDVNEEFFLEVVQEQTGARAHDGVGRHELRVREALVDVLVDDVGLVQDQVALDEDGYLPIGVHDSDVFRLVVEIDVADFEIHAFFEQHEAAALRERAGRSRVENHHVEASRPKKYMSNYMPKKVK